jgi:hypothetical protein
MGAVRHTQQTRARVIEEFRRTGRVDLACAAAGCDRTSHYLWLGKYPDYAAEFETARVQVAGLLEDEAVRRAYQGTAKPVSIGGKLVMLHEFSDSLLMFLLKARNRKVFGEVNSHRLVDEQGNDRTFTLDDLDRMIADDDKAEAERGADRQEPGKVPVSLPGA